MREIHAAPFTDRVVHHWLVPRLEHLFEPVFIYDSYSNRRGKGTHAAVARLQQFLRAPGSTCFLQLDISNFFNSVHRPTLFYQLQHRIRKALRQGKTSRAEAPALRSLCHHLLRQDVSAAVQVGSPQAFARLPAHRRLANAGPERGLPIGNLTSQFFANVYLNDLDQFVKHTLGCRYYCRYVDDFILLHDDAAQLQAWYKAIVQFLDQRLKLTLKSGSLLRPVSNGIDFLGYIVRRDYMLVRRRVIGNLRERLNFYTTSVLGGKRRRFPQTAATGAVELTLPLELREKICATLASYWGHFNHAHSYRLKQAFFHRYPWLHWLFHNAITLAPRWQPTNVSSFRSQCRYFSRAYPGLRLLIQKGKEFVELDAGTDVESSPRSLGKLRGRRSILRRQGISHCFIAEEGYLKGGLKRRTMRLCWWPERTLMSAGFADPIHAPRSAPLVLTGAIS